MIMKTVAAAAACAVSFAAFAWDGYDYENGAFVEIQKGNLVRQGNEIEVYEYGAGYKNFDVESVERRGNIVELEVTDTETGETRTFEMEDD